MAISFERLVSRDLVRLTSNELDLAGLKMTPNKFFSIAIIGGVLIFAIIAFGMFALLNLSPGLSVLVGIVGSGLYEVSIYAILEFIIDRRKTFLEGILADYLQIVAADVRSGMSLDKAMLQAARPEFGFFSEDVKLVNAQIYAGETIQNALTLLGEKYRSNELKHTIRLMIEALQYGGGITDLLNQIAKDIRTQQIVQKDIAGQLFMYTIFIAFAALIGAPALFALTSQMVQITNTVWTSILQQNPQFLSGGAGSFGSSFLKPSKPQITTQDYKNFAYASIFVITCLSSFIVSAISTGSAIKGLRYMPVFILVGFLVFFLVSTVIGGVFNSLGAG